MDQNCTLPPIHVIRIVIHILYQDRDPDHPQHTHTLRDCFMQIYSVFFKQLDRQTVQPTMPKQYLPRGGNDVNRPLKIWIHTRSILQLQIASDQI